MPIILRSADNKLKTQKSQRCRFQSRCQQACGPERTSISGSIPKQKRTHAPFPSSRAEGLCFLPGTPADRARPPTLRTVIWFAQFVHSSACLVQKPDTHARTHAHIHTQRIMLGFLPRHLGRPVKVTHRNILPSHYPQLSVTRSTAFVQRAQPGARETVGRALVLPTAGLDSMPGTQYGPPSPSPTLNTSVTRAQLG